MVKILGKYLRHMLHDFIILEFRLSFSYFFFHFLGGGGGYFGSWKKPFNSQWNLLSPLRKGIEQTLPQKVVYQDLFISADWFKNRIHKVVKISTWTTVLRSLFVCTYIIWLFSLLFPLQKRVILHLKNGCSSPKFDLDRD